MKRTYLCPVVVRSDDDLGDHNETLTYPGAFIEQDAQNWRVVVIDTDEDQHADMLALNGVQYLGEKADPQPE